MALSNSVSPTSSTLTTPTSSNLVTPKYPYPSTINVGNFVSIKLKQTNFLLWQTQVMGLIESQEIFGFLNGEIPMSEPQLIVSSTEVVDGAATGMNPKYIAWRRSDRLLRWWITCTLSEEVLGLVVGLGTSVEVWRSLYDSFAQESQGREFYLIQSLQMHTKGTSTMSEYIRIFKGYCDDLVAIGKPVDDRTKVLGLLKGLGRGYESFVTTMFKPPVQVYRELIPLMHAHETMKKFNDSGNSNIIDHNMVFLDNVHRDQILVVTGPFTLDYKRIIGLFCHQNRSIGYRTDRSFASPFVKKYMSFT